MSARPRAGIAGKLRAGLRRLAIAAGLHTPGSEICRGYINARAMVKGAAAAGVDVNEFIQSHQGWPRFLRQAEEYADRLVASGALSEATRDVVEIGAGSGRHARILKARFPALHYTAYEADPVWRGHLRDRYGLAAPELHGEKLNATADASADLVHAVLTLVYLPFLSVVSYFNEAARALRPGGFFHFDIYTEGSFTRAALDRWLASPDRYPAIFPRDFLVRLLEERGLTLRAETFEPDHETFEFLFQKRR